MMNTYDLEKYSDRNNDRSNDSLEETGRKQNEVQLGELKRMKTNGND